MDTIVVDRISYYLPVGISDVQQLITTARQTRKQIRVRGSNHSVPASIYPDVKNADYQDSIFVLLSKMNTVNIDKKQKTVIVEAGCHLGYDPYDPTYISTLENSLFFQLHQAGFAIPDMGGITHQTVGGFLSTASSGGSTKYSFFDSLESVTFFPADTDCPLPITASRSENEDVFYAVGVSMGLLGIIVSATFRLEEHFNIKGTETITCIEDCLIDMTGTGVSGKKSLKEFLTTADYARLLWYPQPKIPRVTVWQAGRIAPDPDFEPIPYHEFQSIFKSETIPQIAANAVYTAIGRWPGWLGDIIGTNNNVYQNLTAFASQNFYSQVFPQVLPLFVKNDADNKEHPHEPQVFQDYWYAGLPMDDKVNDKMFPVEFTELWIPFDESGSRDIMSEVLVTLNEIFAAMYADEKGPIPDGAFTTEIYAAKKSKFWLSPSYDSDVLRVDVFWFGNNLGSPVDNFYPRFWKALQKFNFRCHWGKYLPPADGEQGVIYLKQQYPKWDDFMDLRRKLDPLQIFVNEYWRQHLGILKEAISI